MSRVFKSLDDLRSLIPESERAQPEAEARKMATAASGGRAFDGKGTSLSLAIEKKGRKGKTVTIVRGLRYDPQTTELLAKALKERLGAGGTVTEGVIEIQGDQRTRAAEALRAMNFRVKA